MSQLPGETKPFLFPIPELAEVVLAAKAKYETTVEPHTSYIPSHEGLDAYAALMGVPDLEGLPIVCVFYQNAVDADHAEYDRRPFTLENPREDPMRVDEMLQDIATRFSGTAEYTEDFYSGFTVQTDENTCVSFGLQQTEFAGICDDCASSGHDDKFHGCDHAEETYEYSRWLLICKPEDVDRIDWERGDVVGVT